MKICHVTNKTCEVTGCPISLYECARRPLGTITATTNHTGIITEKKEQDKVNKKCIWNCVDGHCISFASGHNEDKCSYVFGTGPETKEEADRITEKITNAENNTYILKRPVEGGYIGTERGAGPEPVGESQEELLAELIADYIHAESVKSFMKEEPKKFHITRKEK